MQRQRKVHGLLGEKKKRRQKNRPLTENCTHDWKGLVNRMNNTRLSPCNYGFHYTTMHLSHTVTAPLSVSVYVRTHKETQRQSHTATHTQRESERGRLAEDRIYNNSCCFFCNLLKEMYASKQNVVNPQAWLYGLWEKNKTILSWSNAKTQQKRNWDFNHRLLGAYRELHRQLQLDTLSFYSFKSFLHMLSAWTVWKLRGFS